MAEDDDVSVYADDKGAVLITHDAELTERRKVNTFGKHVRLKGQQPDAREVLEAHLDELVTELGVLGHQVRDSRLIGGRPPRELWGRSVL